jgi:hypothetical protein
MTSQAYQKGETVRSVGQRDDRAYARITATAQKSNAATFRNIQGPYHRTGENRRIVTVCHKTPECSNGYRQKRRKHDRCSSRLFFILYLHQMQSILYY